MPIELKAGASTLSLQASGKDGKDGASVINMYIDNINHLICVLSNGEVIDAGAVPTDSYIIQYEETLTTSDIEDIVSRFNNGQQIIVLRVSHAGEADETHLQYRMVRYTDNYLYFENTFAYSGTNTIQTAMITINRGTCAWNKEIYNTYKDSYIDTIKGTFVAVYGNTPFEEIYAAFNAGKTVICVSGNTVFTLTSCNSSYATFTKVTYAAADSSNPPRFQLATFNVVNSIEGGYQSIQYKYVETSRANGGSSTTALGITSKVSVINDTNAAVDRAFPNVKAVKDYVDGGNVISEFQIHVSYDEVLKEFTVDSYSPVDVDVINKCQLCRVELPNDTVITLHRTQNVNPYPFMLWVGDEFTVSANTHYFGGELVVDDVYFFANLENFPVRSVSVNGEELPKSEENFFNVNIPIATVASGSTQSKAGVVKVASENGITLDSNNQLQTVGVSEAQLDQRTNTKRVITSHRLDYAFMKCFTDPKLKDAQGRIRNWTDEERLAALRTLGCTVDSNGFVKWTAQ